MHSLVALAWHTLYDPRARPRVAAPAGAKPVAEDVFERL